MLACIYAKVRVWAIPQPLPSLSLMSAATCLSSSPLTPATVRLSPSPLFSIVSGVYARLGGRTSSSGADCSEVAAPPLSGSSGGAPHNPPSRSAVAPLPTLVAPVTVPLPTQPSWLVAELLPTLQAVTAAPLPEPPSNDGGGAPPKPASADLVEDGMDPATCSGSGRRSNEEQW